MSRIRVEMHTGPGIDDGRPGTATIAARLNRLPPTRTHRQATVIAGIGSFFDLFDIFLAGVLGTVLTQRFGLDRLLLPIALSSAFVGMFIGATVLGRFADRAGRRTAFLLNLGIYSAFTLAGAFSVNAPMLIASRFLAGIGIGAELTLVDAYLSELLPARLRGRYTAWAYTLGFIGVPAAGLLGRILVPLTPLGIDGWRWLFVAGSLGALIVWFVRMQLPESPRWLESVGRIAEAEAIVDRMEQEAGVALASIEREFARCRRREARRAVSALRRAIPFARDHARRLSHLPDDRILRLWHPRAVGARVEGLLGRDVADVHDAHIHRLSGWFGPVAPDHRARRSEMADSPAPLCS